MTAEQESRPSSPLQRLAEAATRLVCVKTARGSRKAQKEAVAAVADTLAENPNLIGPFTETQKKTG